MWQRKIQLESLLFKEVLKLSEKLNEVILKSWESYTMTFTLTMSEETLIKHFCEYLMRVADNCGDDV